MNDELIGGIRNALERGSSLEQAVQSLINAGYNPLEVKEASKFFNQTASSISSSVTIVGPPLEKPKAKSILSFSKPQQQTPSQNPPTPQVQQQVIQQKPINIEKQIQKDYPQIVSPSIQAPARNPIDIEKERKQTIAILLAILILILGMVILILMFKEEILNLVS
jgi:hypothetical protein